MNQEALMLAAKKSLSFLPDETYLRLYFRLRLHRKLDLENPVYFNDKLQWLKLYDHDPRYTVMADKYRMKELVEQKLGPGYTVPLLGVWDHPDQIDFDALPDRFVLKCNHNSGTGMYICRDKARMDADRVRKGLRKGLAEDFYKVGREWPYRDIPRKVLCEQFMEDTSGNGNLMDYKFFCFNGEPRLMYLSQECVDHSPQSFYDMSFRRLDLTEDDPAAAEPIEKPEGFDEMRRIAGIFAQGIPFLRVDFYYIDHRIYIGEFTFFHNSGFHRMEPREWEKKLGDAIVLPPKKC